MSVSGSKFKTLTIMYGENTVKEGGSKIDISSEVSLPTEYSNFQKKYRGIYYYIACNNDSRWIYG